MSPQVQLFVTSIACGAVSLLVWDMLHGLRVTCFKGIISNVLLDLIWWAAAGSGFVYCMWNYGSMDLRFFVFLGACAGAVLYRFTLSGLLRLCFCKIFGIFYKIIQFILKILLTPAAFLYKILVVCIFSKFKRKSKKGNAR